MIIQVAAINGLGRTKGCELAPELICNQLRLKSESMFLNNDNLDEQESEIYNNAKRILNIIKSEKEKVIFIGGDHSMSYPIGKAFLEKTRNPAIIVFDAHPDLMKPMQNPTHEGWLRALIENKKFRNILLIGIRRNSKNVDKKETEFAKKNSIKIIYSDEFEKRQNEILEFCKNKQIYISLDVDVFDEDLIDSTGYLEKDGLKENLIELIKKIKNPRVIDLVELNPKKGNFKKSMKIIEKVISVFGYL